MSLYIFGKQMEMDVLLKEIVIFSVKSWKFSQSPNSLDRGAICDAFD